ncbi:ABC transporter permease [Methylobacterium indicum]|uniref:Peptide ABC transporter n=2 Tax=Pseudomonadota TaxID=1224 RepID=A0A0J6RKR5_9HYPH|nr:ABC transporter permease [Methylobacterium indicum]KMO20328.1 peptide ABC transporter [Methylobacterium indicum]KMO21923.1 peptide ABC transporter [Methylobacterium indicum]BCM82024.1 peptide ABC transporter permease [Methylobacterium indicum]
MLRHFLRRAAGFAVTFLLISILVFCMMEIVPGDPASAMLGTSATPETLAALRAQMGLDAPAYLRYLRWLGGLLVGDMGTSTTYGVPVGALIRERLAVTLPLTGLAVLMAVGIALPLGVTAAARPGGVADGAATLYAQAGIAVPNFWIGLLLIMVVALGLGWLPAGGFPGWDDPAAAFRALLLPALALAIPQSAVLTRVTRASVVEVMNEDFVRTARAKGASVSRALWRHAVPNALVPVITMLGLQISFLIGGAVLVENVFTLPGMGRLAWQALSQRDLIVIQNVVMVFATIVIVVNLGVDLLYTVVDPRLRRRA